LTESAIGEPAADESGSAAGAADISARLWLVRHAQASFGSANYDQLSERGEQQAQRLAQWLISDPDLRFAHVVTGTLQRHVQTLAPIARAFDAAGRALPSAVHDADWNEFQHEAVIRAWADAHAGDPLLAAARNATDRRTVHALLAAALHAWASRELDGAVPETWDAFGARVVRARARLEALPRGKVLVISSGGPITRCAQFALGCDAQRAVKLNLALRNSAISEFRAGRAGWDLQIWNMLPHLSHAADRGWVTYY
jgi:broad specificity phosphatase PhoE